MLTGRTHRQPRPGGDAGMTLVELLVGMVLLVLAGTLGLRFFIGTTSQAGRTTRESLDSGAARATLDQIANVLRVADTPTATPGYSTARFTTITPTRVVLYANLSTTGRTGTGVRIPPSRVDISLSAGFLTESIYAPKATTYATGYDYTQNYNTTPTSKTVLLSGVSNTDLFTYCSAATDPSVSCTATTDPAAVAMVQVKLSVVTATADRAQTARSTQTVQSGIAITGAVS